MSRVDRRAFVGGAAAAAAGAWLLSRTTDTCASDAVRGGGLELATFRFDVTPPIGHACCGGWIKDIEAVDDPLEAVGLVLLGADQPIVLCAVDWTGILNGAHVEWRQVLAEAAGTTPDRVSVHCVHQHNAPLACLEAERLASAQGDLPHVIDLSYFRQCLDRARTAIQQSLRQSRRVTHVAHGAGIVEKVAGNRRVFRDDQGAVKAMRGSACTDETLRNLPEGTIDPKLRTVAFYDGERKLAACHYYATHPMSYYGDGLASSDFAGLARKRRQQDEPDCLHLYFTGCAGNIAAGKYNDGSKEMRAVLTQRIYDGIVRSENELRPTPIGKVAWKTAEILPPPRASLAAAALAMEIANKENAKVNRLRPAYMLSWLRRLEAKTPLVLSALHVNDIRLLHLPGEPFIEYQLRAQSIAQDSAVATAAYGDGGPWYIPVKEEYPNGGYEVSVAFSDPGIDDQLTDAMRRLCT